MEKITRFIQRERRGDFTQTFQFTTYDIIFDKEFRKRHPEAAGLMAYLEDRFIHGLPERALSPSKMPELIIETKQVLDHPYSRLAHESQYYGSGNRQHLIVQNYFLKNLAECLAFEVPVYDDEASGCIDLVTLSLKPFMVGVWDVKPDAIKEKKAASQNFRYAKMLMEKAGIPKENISVGYFDGVHFFEVLIKQYL